MAAYVHPSRRPGPYTPTRGQFAGVTFGSFRQYQNALAQAQGFRSHVGRLRAPRPITTRAADERLRPAERQTRERALQALTYLRRGQSLRQAAREAQTTVQAVLRYAGSALTRGPRGRYVPRPIERLYRPLRLITTQGVVEVGVRDSRTASLLARHANAVRHYLETGDAAPLAAFRGRTVRAEKRGYRLLDDRDLALLDQLGAAGEARFEDLYVWAA